MLAHMDTHRDGARAHRRVCRLCRGGLDAWKRSETHRYMWVHVRTCLNHGLGPGKGLGMSVRVSTGGSMLATQREWARIGVVSVDCSIFLLVQSKGAKMAVMNLFCILSPVKLNESILE